MATTNFRGIYAIKPWWQRQLTGMENWLVKRRVHPNLVTLAGVGCAGLLGVVLAASARWPWLDAGGCSAGDWAAGGECAGWIGRTADGAGKRER